jgi:hypothetical protein
MMLNTTCSRGEEVHLTEDDSELEPVVGVHDVIVEPTDQECQAES